MGANLIGVINIKKMGNTVFGEISKNDVLTKIQKLKKYLAENYGKCYCSNYEKNSDSDEKYEIKFGGQEMQLRLMDSLDEKKLTILCFEYEYNEDVDDEYDADEYEQFCGSIEYEDLPILNEFVLGVREMLGSTFQVDAEIKALE